MNLRLSVSGRCSLNLCNALHVGRRSFGAARVVLQKLSIRSVAEAISTQKVLWVSIQADHRSKAPLERCSGGAFAPLPLGSVATGE